VEREIGRREQLRNEIEESVKQVLGVARED
jgi:hypothetical protein